MFLAASSEDIELKVDTIRAGERASGRETLLGGQVLAGEKSGEIGGAHNHATLDELHYPILWPSKWLVYERREMEGHLNAW